MRSFPAKGCALSWRPLFAFAISTYGACPINAKNPLHGITLEALLTSLVTHYGWDGLAQRLDVRCFKNDPSIKSSLSFLRKTPWAREKVEALYVQLHRL